MKTSLAVFAAVALLACSSAVRAVETAARIPLRVLYVGSDNGVAIVGYKGTPEARDAKNAARATAFQEFLAQHFTTVKACTAAGYTATLGNAADVVVLDAALPAAEARAFNRPAVAIGMAGVRNSILRGSKLDWLCACLDNRLYDVRSDHAIFRGPLPVQPTLVDEIDPMTRRPVRTWKAHEPMIDEIPGLVVSGEYLLEAADSEIISGGLNLKGDHGIALAREANIFHWGPAGDPRNFTDEAKRVLVNAIAYIRQFGGAEQTVRRGLHPRSVAMEAISSPYVTLKNMAEWIPGDVMDRTGGDKAKLTALYQGSEPWLWVPPHTSALTIDEDARSLGLPNNDVRLLEKCVTLLDDSGESAKARRLLERYTGLQFGGRSGWAGWLAANGAQLYFADTYGYRFFTGPAGAGPTQAFIRNAVAQLTQPETSEVAPVSIAAAIATASDLPYATIGDRMTLVARVRIRDGWHTYESVPEGNPMLKTELDFNLPDGLRWAGEWRMTRSGPPDKKTGVVEQRDEILFTRPLYVAAIPAAAPGAARTRGGTSIAGELRFQVCDAQRCLQPAAVPVEAKINLMAR